MSYAPLQALFLGKQEIEQVAPSRKEIIELIEQTYRWHAEGKAEVPAKIGVHPARANSFLHAMPGWVSGMNALGSKIVTYYPGNYDRGFQESTAIILLYDDDNGQPLAIMEGMWITFARTTACAAVAAKHLANPEPRRLGLVGCGGLGYWSLLMFSEAFPSLEEVYVASRRPESRKAFCEKMAGEGSWTLHAVDDIREAVEGMDIIVSSTPQQPEPRLFGDWWKPGAVAVPLDYPFSWDDAALAQANRLVTDGMATIERMEREAPSGPRPDLAMPSERLELADVVAGRVKGRRAENERIFAPITGIASTDLTVALEIYRRAKDARLGQMLRID